jgi:hypothetical protein
VRRLFQPLTSQNSNDIISVSHRGAIIIPLLSLIAILLCGNNNDSTKKPRCKSSVLFLRGFLDALARVPVAPLGYRLRVAPGPRLPRRSLACGRFAPGAQIGLSRKRAKRPRPQWGLGGLAAASRSAFAPRGALKRFGPAPPRRSTSLNKRTRVKATPGFAALAFFSLRAPVSRSAARSLVLSRRSPGPGPPRRGPAIAARFSRGFAGLRPSGFLAPFGGGALAWSLSLPALAVRLCRPAAFFCECFHCPFNHPPAPPILAGGARKLCAYFSPCDLICHCVHHRYTGVAMVH